MNPFVGSLRPWMRNALLLACASIVLTIGGCGRQTRDDVSETGITDPTQPTRAMQVDSTAEQVRIDERGATPDTVKLSKSRREKVQWTNTFAQAVLLVFDAHAIGEVIAAGQPSAVHEVCLTCPEGGSYPYKIYRRGNNASGEPEWQVVPQVSGGPDPPQVDVGN